MTKTSNEEKQALKLHANRNITYLLDQLAISYNDRGNSLIQSVCPAHQHGGDKTNTSAFSWRSDLGRWICWSHHCEENYGNDIFGLVSSVLNIGFLDAIKWVSQKLEEKNIEITLDNIETPQTYQRDTFHTHEPLKEDNLKFLKSELDFLINRGFSRLVLQDYQAGLWQRPGTFMHDRIVFPVRDHDGFLVGYTGRTIHSEDYFKNKGLDYKKWIHGRHFNYWSKDDSFKTGSILFNLYRAKRFLNEKRSIILVEGPLDGMKLEMANIHNWVATLGTKFSYSHRTLLVKYGITDLHVAYDNDLPKGPKNTKAGDDGWKRTERIVGDLFHLHKVELPLGKDCGDLTVEELHNIFR